MKLLFFTPFAFSYSFEVIVILTLNFSHSLHLYFFFLLFIHARIEIYFQINNVLYKDTKKLIENILTKQDDPKLEIKFFQRV
jgi:hypothetical protein